MKRNSATDELLQESLKEKWRELKFLKYSKTTITKAKRVMAGKFPDTKWE
jgi:hypothetical protein